MDGYESNAERFVEDGISSHTGTGYTPHPHRVILKLFKISDIHVLSIGYLGMVLLPFFCISGIARGGER